MFHHVSSKSVGVTLYFGVVDWLKGCISCHDNKGYYLCRLFYEANWLFITCDFIAEKLVVNLCNPLCIYIYIFSFVVVVLLLLQSEKKLSQERK